MDVQVSNWEQTPVIRTYISVSKSQSMTDFQGRERQSYVCLKENMEILQFNSHTLAHGWPQQYSVTTDDHSHGNATP